MGTITRFEDIEAWKRARELNRKIYACTRLGPFAKDFALKDQIRRASISAMSNIAEGFERDGNQEFLQFLATAKGSIGEVRSQLYAAVDEGYISQLQFVELSRDAESVSKMIWSFMAYLRNTSHRGIKYSQRKPKRKPEN